MDEVQNVYECSWADGRVQTFEGSTTAVIPEKVFRTAHSVIKIQPDGVRVPLKMKTGPGWKKTQPGDRRRGASWGCVGGYHS